MKSTILSLISTTLMAATAVAQDLKILEDSCASGAFEAASSSSDRPCQTTDFLCVCTTGKDWYDNYITEYLTNHPGTCTEAEIQRKQTNPYYCPINNSLFLHGFPFPRSVAPDSSRIV